MWTCPKEQPAIAVIDFANMVATHGNRRFPGMFAPHEGRIAPATPANIQSAKDGTLNWPWFPSSGGTRSSRFLLMLTLSQEFHYALVDSFHEENSKDPKNLLRRVGFVPKLDGVNTEVAEQLNFKRN